MRKTKRSIYDLSKAHAQAVLRHAQMLSVRLIEAGRYKSRRDD
jgi:hypothetical protein